MGLWKRSDGSMLVLFASAVPREHLKVLLPCIASTFLPSSASPPSFG